MVLKSKPSNRKDSTSVSLGDELAELIAVLESAELLAELVAHDDLPDAESSAKAPKLLVSVIAIALGRVRLLRQVVLRQLDPSVLANRRNKRPSTLAAWEDPDIVLATTGRPRRKP